MNIIKKLINLINFLIFGGKKTINFDIGDLPGIKPATSGLWVHCLNHWATGGNTPIYSVPPKTG